jgi:hypothetical protein
MLGSCAASDPWAPYTSNSTAFITFVSCDAQLNNLPGYGTYYHAPWAAPQSGLQSVSYYNGRNVQTEPVYVLFLRNRQQQSFRVTAEPYGVRCAAVVLIPWSLRINRPYDLEDEPEKVEAHYGTLVAWHNLILCIMAAALLTGSLLTWFSYGQEKRGEFVTVSALAVLLWINTFGVGLLTVLQPWSVVRRALAYYEFYDSLPKQSGWLEPVSADVILGLLQAPPLPSQIGFSIAIFASTAFILSAAWLGCLARPIIDGAYWVLVPLPTEQVHAQALAEGRAPTADELMQALSDTLAGKSSWQLDVMRRKAKAFRQTLEQQMQHGG